MAFLDHNGESEFPMSKDKVFDAINSAVPRLKGMKIHSSDKLQGRILVKVGVSIWSWGENVPIQLTELSENKTKVQITSSPKTGLLFGGAFDMGKNRKNIENILSATSKILSSSDNISNQNNSTQIFTAMENLNEKSSAWYEKSWLAILLCVVFFPVGLYALWKNSSIAKGWKIAITAIIAIVFIANFNDKSSTASTSTQTKKENTESTESTATTDQSSESSESSQQPTYAKIGDQITVDNFVYRVNSVKFMKSIGDEFTKQKADGIYIVVDLSLKNLDSEQHTLDNSLFKLTDESGTEFESSTDATTALEMQGKETLFLKECNPKIQKQGLLVFEVPQKGVYDLHLSGGFWSGETAVVKLTVN